MGLRQTIGRRLLGDEWAKLQEGMEALATAYRRGPYVLTPESLERQLLEIDSQFVDLLMQQRGFDIIGGRGLMMGQLDFTEADRLNIVGQSRWAFHFDVQAARAVNAWTDFGFGRNIKVVPQDERLVQFWDEFWSAPRNRPILKQSNLDNLSDKLVIDGELFFAFFADVTGRVTIRRFDTDDITDVIYEKDKQGNEDLDVALFYVQSQASQAIWWPDWAASKEQLDRVELPQGVVRADQMDEMTHVVMQRVSFNDIKGRGWPMTYRAIPWYTEYKEALHDWSAVAASVAMFPKKVKHKGGSRTTDDLKSALESTFVQSGYGTDRNPPAPAGTTWLENQQASLEFNNPMRTGATEWQSGTMLLAGQMVAGDGLPMAYRGRPDSMQNRAVAEVTTIPWDQQTARYAGLWIDTLQEWVEIIAAFAVGFGGEAPYQTLTADVSADRPSTLSTTTEDLINALTTVDVATVNATLPPDEGQQAADTLLRLILGRFGATMEQKEDNQPDGNGDIPEPQRVSEADEEDILYTDGDVTITKQDVKRSIEQAGKRVSPEFAQILRGAE